MSLCVHCSVKHPYCFTFAPPYALRLTLDFCRAIGRPWMSFCSGNRCLYTRSGITFTSAPLSILHSTRMSVVCPLICMFANAWDLLPFLYIDSILAIGAVSIESSTKCSSLSLLTLSQTVCPSSTVSMFAFRIVLVLLLMSYSAVSLFLQTHTSPMSLSVNSQSLAIMRALVMNASIVSFCSCFIVLNWNLETLKLDFGFA